MGFLDNRINFSIDWYKRNNYDLIGITPTQGVGGSIYKYANIASMKQEYPIERLLMEYRFHLFQSKK